MSDHPVFWVGNRNPSIQDVIAVNGTPVNLTGHTVRFRAREIGSSALLVDQPVSNTLDASGVVRYDWSSADIAGPDGILFKARRCLVWWEDTVGSKTQDVNEAIIEIRAHGPEGQSYLELEEFKSSAELKGTSFADEDIRAAIVGASRAIDAIKSSFYYLGPANEVRYYTARRRRTRVLIDPLVDLDALATDPNGGSAYGDTWAENTDFVLEPLNATVLGQPWNELRVLPTGGYPSLPGYTRAVRVTGQFGWLAVPDAIRAATKIIATRVVKMTREAPFGVVALGADGTAVTIARNDPVVAQLLAGVPPIQVLA